MSTDEPSEQEKSEALRERVRKMPGVIVHHNPDPVPFIPEFEVTPGVTIEELLTDGYCDPIPAVELLKQGSDSVNAWEANWPPFIKDESLHVVRITANRVIAELTERLTENYPFFHPSYAGQMLKPAHEIATVAYALAQRINPNNHALDGGPATAKMEREVVADLAVMFGYDPAHTLGHLTSSGTIANLEALWIARSLHPDQAIAFSAEAHYTHARMCEVIGVRAVKIAADGAGRLDPNDLQAKLQTERIGTVVATIGATGLGAVDPIPELLDLQREYDFRIHVDAAYGGFYTLLAGDEDDALSPADAAAYHAISRCDSIVVDPHKHGLQPYGCGSVLFRDPAVGRFYQHDSPYTYFTSDDLHLGEISLECSRAGAAAAALWATLQCFPLRPNEGLGPVLRRCRQAALTWADLIRASDRLCLMVEPSLDILTFYALPPDGDRRVSAISALTERVFAAGMADREQPFYLAKLVARPDLLQAHADLVWDAPTLTLFRSVLMKPEHLAEVPRLHERVMAVLRDDDWD